MLGRDTPSEGLDMTAAWIAAEFERYGLQPGGDDGTYLQRWPYRAYALDHDATTVTVEGGPALVLGEDLVHEGSPVDGSASGELVLLAGSEFDRAALETLDLEGRVVLLFPGSEEVERAARFFQGAEAVLRVVEMDDEAWNELATASRERTSRIYGDAPDFDGTPRFAIRRAAAEGLLEAAGASAPDPTGPLTQTAMPGLSVTVETAVRAVDDAMPPNVVGILPGSDPELRDEYVIFSAHMDHVGVNAARAREDSVFDETGAFVRLEMDSIFNGADDDASGTIAVVEVAEAFAMLAEPPRRSMVFLAVSGEEKGLLGSRWYADHPTVPAEGIVANFNTDMIGRNWEDTVVVIGKEHSELGRIMNEVGAAHPELNMAPIDDRWPEQNFYRRSDHFNFARRGVPVLFFFTGVHEDYHQATDEIRDLMGEKASRIAKLVFYLSHDVGTMDEAPRWYDDSYDEYVSDAPGNAPRRSMPRASEAEGDAGVGGGG